jgi:Gluconate 2-dehydrogenase subunit 3
MPISRRQLLKQILFVSAGSAMIPSCLLLPQSKGIKLKHISVTADQEMILAAFADTLIPKTETEGALDVQADLFVWKILDDCTPKEEQEKFLKGLNTFSAAFQKQYQHFFSNASVSERFSFMEQLDLQKDSEEPLVVFYNKAKQRLIQAYTGSAFFMTNIQVYEQIPSRFHGCVPVSNNTSKKS